MEDEDAVDPIIPITSIPIPSWKERRERQRETNRARNRLFSIERDVTDFLSPLHKQAKKHPIISAWPWLANERCGCWSAHPITKQSCYFKSVDGHVNTWNMSWKRLNLHLVRMLGKTGGCWIVDASRTKVFPDSLARTIPIWAVVMNRIILRFRQERGMEAINCWDVDLHTPTTITAEEHATMSSLVDARVEGLYNSGVLLQPEQLMASVTKPLRPVWITAQDLALATTETETPEFLSSLFASWASLSKDYQIIVCVSSSFISFQQPNEQQHDDDSNLLYSPGAGDDEESWSRGLTPALFWKHRQKIISTQTCDETDAVIRQVMVANKAAVSAAGTDAHEEGNEVSLADALGSMGVHVGSRRAGHPPECWESFDAVLNVTVQVYESLEKASGIPENKYYLQLPVEEGKRDKHELEKWLAVGIVFVVHHAAKGRKVLIHCAQGRDRSVAVAMSVAALFGDQKSEELCFRPDIHRFLSWTSQASNKYAENPAYGRSGMTNTFVESLLGRLGRDRFLQNFSEIFNDDDEKEEEGQYIVNKEEGQDIVNKQSLRIALHSIQRYREKASPTRSTIQKLNRFFMSSSYEGERGEEDSQVA
jgi:tRNA A64-2'-O-ribosylphosphate transferase